jgi:hypothetical protein
VDAVWMDILDKGMVLVLSGIGGMVQDFTMLVRKAHDSKLMNHLFLEFSI